jgi:hypothetical protein
VSYTINQIKKRLEDFANAHLQLKGSVSFGELEEVSNQGVLKFPYMFGILQPGSFIGKQFEVRMTIVIMDLVEKDLSNRWEVWSDTQLMFGDLRAFLNDPDFDDEYVFDDNITLTPFADRFTDDVTGWSADVTFRINELKDRCAIPL